MKNLSGIYNKNQKKYSQLITRMYDEYSGGINFSSEYAYFVEHDILQLFIRLARYKFVARMISKTDTVLDVGCGSGLGSIFLSQHCKYVYGCDVKLTEIEDARKINRRKNVEFLHTDLFKLDKAKKYDVIVAMDVVEHYSVRQAQKLLQEMSLHVNAQGILIIGTPSKYSYPYQGKLSQASHKHCYDQEELVRLIGKFFHRTLPFSMNDELVHTGFGKLAWYYMVIGMYKKI